MWYGIYQSQCQTNVLSCILGTAGPYGIGDVSLFFSPLSGLSSWKEPVLWSEIFFSAKETKKKNHVIPTWLSAFSAFNPIERHENRQRRSTLIEAQLKHVNALILFSFGTATWRWLVVWFSDASNGVVWTASTCVCSFWCLTKRLSLSNHLQKGLDVYIGRNPITHSCLFPWAWEVALCVMLYKNEKSMHAYTLHKMCTAFILAICTLLKKIFYMLLVLETLLALFYSLDGLRPLPKLFLMAEC